MISETSEKAFFLQLEWLEKVRILPWSLEKESNILRKVSKKNILHLYMLAGFAFVGELSVQVVLTYNALTRNLTIPEIFMYFSVMCVVTMFITIKFIPVMFLDEARIYINRFFTFNKTVVQSFDLNVNDRIVCMVLKALPIGTAWCSLVAMPGIVFAVESSEFKNLVYGFRQSIMISLSLGFIGSFSIFLNWQIINICFGAIFMHFYSMREVSIFIMKDALITKSKKLLTTSSKHLLYRSLQILHAEVMEMTQYTISAYFSAGVFLAITQMYQIVKYQTELPPIVMAGVLIAALMETTAIIMFTKFSWDMTHASSKYSGNFWNLAHRKTEDDKFRRSCRPLQVTIPYILTITGDTMVDVLQFMVTNVASLLLTF